jgi:hypothetical protein
MRMMDVEVARLLARAARSLGPRGRRWGGLSRFLEVERRWRPACVLGALQPRTPRDPSSFRRAVRLLERLVLRADAWDASWLAATVGSGRGVVRWTDAPRRRGAEVRRFLRRAAAFASGRLFAAAADEHARPEAWRRAS